MHTEQTMSHKTQTSYMVASLVAVGVALLVSWLSPPPELPSFLFGFVFLFILNAVFGEGGRRTFQRVIITPLAAGFSVVGVHHVVGAVPVPALRRKAT